jgi:acyl-CoA thioesterase I
MSPTCRSAFAVLIAFILCSTAALAAPVRIVAVGASNTHGWYVGNAGSYPTQLQAMLQARGIEAEITNAGVPFDTSFAMLARIDQDVPDGTDIAILQPGSNDRRFFGTAEQRAANVAEMTRRLNARGIDVVVFDQEMPSQYYTLDFIHFTYEGHTHIATELLPRVIEAVQRRTKKPRPVRRAASPR